MVPFLGTLGGRDRRFGRRVVRHLLETPSSLPPLEGSSCVQRLTRLFGDFEGPQEI
jgi:hypothetical protein